MKFFFIRHGQDDVGYRGGWSANHLINEGIDQINKLAEFLITSKMVNQKVKIISSDLNRAKETAAIIAKALHSKVEYSQMWREINNGKLAGMRNEDANLHYPGLYFSTLMMDEHYPEGESPAEFFARIKQAYTSMLQYSHDEDVVIVTHSGVIDVIYHLINELPWTNNSPIKFSIKHGGLLSFDTENKKTFIK